MVVPLRLRPGMRASPWANPITSATHTVSSRKPRGLRGRMSVHQRRTPVRKRVPLMASGVAKICSKWPRRVSPITPVTKTESRPSSPSRR
jgi:hypothetical protein